MEGLKPMRFRVEFNEDQQGFHLELHGKSMVQPNTHGWKTIIENCSDDYFKIFKAYASRLEKEKLTVDYLLQSAQELENFLKNLLEYNIGKQIFKMLQL
jgi:hypothetical protein